MTTNITLIPGDGIGPEVTRAVCQILDAAGCDISWDVQTAGASVYETEGELLPRRVFDSLEQNKVALKGPIMTPIGTGHRSVNVALRLKYDLYANVRPCQSVPGVNTRFENVNLVIFRENTEDLYAGIEKKISEDEFHSIKVITRSKSERIARAAFEYAEKTGRKQVTVVTKANIMKLTDGLFLDVARSVAAHYPQIILQEVLVDAMCMNLVIRPEQYDIILTENLYGDILSDLCAGLVGGLGLAPAANLGEKIAVFEAVHGTAPDIAGKNIANPTALLLAACLMLEHLGKNTAAEHIRAALFRALAHSNTRTTDLNGTLTTSEFTNVIIKNLSE